MISTITKRDGRKTTFDKEKIAQAIFKAATKMGGNDYQLAQSLAEEVVKYLENENSNQDITVEHVQDVVEKVLIETGHAQRQQILSTLQTHLLGVGNLFYLSGLAGV